MDDLAVGTPAAVGRARWLRARQRGIGGSDAAAILGVSPFATEFDVWRDKVGVLESKPDTEAMWWGREMESLLARRYSERTGRSLLLLDPPGILQHASAPEIIGTPDRIVMGEERGLELKTAGEHGRHEWGLPGSDDIPAHYLAQCVHYMAVTGFPVWDVAVLIGGNDFRIYHVHRDEALERAVVDRLRAWWQEHVVRGEPVPPAGTKSNDETLRRMFPTHTGDVVLAPRELEPAAATLAALMNTEKLVKAKAAEARAQLKLAIGANAGIESAGWRALWTAPKPKRVTDWQAVANDLVLKLYEVDYWKQHPQTLAELIAPHTTEKPASRRFTFHALGVDETEEEGNA